MMYSASALVYALVVTASTALSLPIQTEYSTKDFYSSSADFTRSNLAQSIQAALNGPMTTESPLPTLTVVTFPDVPQSAANASGTVEQSKQGVVQVNPPKMMTQIAIIQQIPFPSSSSSVGDDNNNNLFTGLAQNVGQLNVEGTIVEAIKLAQISIGLFSQALANQLAMPGKTQLLVINNNTKLIGQ